MINKKIPAFTLAELLVTLALTSLVAGFSYLGYNLIQKLLKQYSDQNLFITQITALNSRLNILSMQTGYVLKEGDNKFSFNADSTQSYIEFKPKAILLGYNNKTDTFNLKPEKLETSFETINTVSMQNKLVNKVDFYVYFEKQKFYLSFYKNYDAASKLILQKESSWPQ